MQSADLVIVGGGPSGMSAALLAGRARLRTVVINAEAPRNAVTHASRGFLSRDGIAPADLFAVSKHQLDRYESVEYITGTVNNVQRHDGGWLVTSGIDQWITTRVLFAMGLRPDLSMAGIPDLDALYGTSIFPCPFCDGFEIADRPLAVFASFTAKNFVPVVLQWSSDVIVFTNDRPVSSEDLNALRSMGVRVETLPVVRLEHETGHLRRVVLDNDISIPREAGFISDPHARLRSPLLDRLGLPVKPSLWGFESYVADDFGKTELEGIYVVGDLKRVFGGTTAAAHDGYLCVAGIVHERATLGQ